MRLIDADAFWKPFEDEKEELENRTIKTSSALTALKFIDFIKRRLDIQPTILQPERKKGRWIEKEYSPFYCSVCGTYQYSASWEIKNKEYNFCPRCGADMRGENDEGHNLQATGD